MFKAMELNELIQGVRTYKKESSELRSGTLKLVGINETKSVYSQGDQEMASDVGRWSKKFVDMKTK